MNESPIGELLTQWSIRTSCALVYARLLYRLWVKTPLRRSPSPLECWLWTSAYILFGLHVWLAFHYIHQWQHSDAWQRTAIETQKLIGLRRGDGIWANYLMLLLWGSDVVRINHASHIRQATSKRIDRVVDLFIGFMFINATVVFGPAFYRHLLFPALAIPLLIWWHRSKTGGQEV